MGGAKSCQTGFLISTCTKWVVNPSQPFLFLLFELAVSCLRGVIEAIMNLSRCLGVFPCLLTSVIFVLSALSQKVQGSGESRSWLSYEQKMAVWSMRAALQIIIITLCFMADLAMNSLFRECVQGYPIVLLNFNKWNKFYFTLYLY